ncbi:ATP-grasp domain-containing protein [Klebsiella sp. DNRA6]|uniref:ATP-grasp domain-containing protein n=1 Tax=Klebsiella sp. DNRA6 TaxID=2723057 RepID=UPI001475CD3A|nr:ATP-grasp domain-containing protein [Klebsiella sp. DNRA6]NMD81423.1 ATP-grasp domain-containing protein [Klebsiella sp. DNRA6]
MSAIVDTRIEEYIVIVDGMGTAKYLAPTFLSLGYPCIHVENKVEHHPALSLSLAPSLYCQLFEYHGDLTDIVLELKKLPVKAIVPGGETGVQLAVELSRALELPFEKGIHPASVFRDKYQLYKTLGQLDESFTYKTYSTLKEFQENLSELGSLLPLVIKPRAGALAFGVSVCEKHEELLEAAKHSFDNNDPFNRGDKPSILVMSKLIGTEYMVNTISSAGIHKVREVWKMQKKIINGVPAYHTADFVHPDDPIYVEIYNTLKVSLDKLGIIDGPCHIEMIKPESRSPIIIDFGYRLHGMLDPSFPFAIYGSSTLLDAAKCIIDNELINYLSYKNNIKSARNVNLHVPNVGLIAQDIDWSIINKIEGVHSIRKVFKKGDVVRLTDSGMNSFATVYLVADSIEQLDIATAKVFESTSSLFKCINSEGM